MAVKKESILVNKIKKSLNGINNSFFFKIHGGPMQMAGISDLIGVFKGKFVAIEVKLPENKKGATALQKWFIDKVKLCGGTGFIARSLEEVYNELGIDSHNIV